MNHFEDLKKSFTKSQKVIEKEGTPRFYIRELFELEKYVSEKWEVSLSQFSECVEKFLNICKFIKDKDFKKKLSKDKSKSLSTLRQRIKKYLQSEEKINAEFEGYKENPDASDAASEDEAPAGEDQSDSEGSLSSSDEEAEPQQSLKH